MKKLLVSAIPRPFRPTIRNGYLHLKGMLQVMRNKRNPLVPPEWKNFSGGGDFEAIGELYFKHFRDIGGLKPSDRVLDIGCGQGRMALPLTGYLTTGSYEGFDIVAEGIRWCRKISRKFPNYNFQLADVYNKNYNPTAKTNAAGYRFPYEDQSFDFIFLTSVFTHMFPAEVDNYLKEIHRVLKPSGRCMITWFILNEESKQLISSGKSSRDIRFSYGNYSIVNEQSPEEAVGFRENVVEDLYRKNNLVIRYPVYYGNWCGRTSFLDYQDIILATKE